MRPKNTICLWFHQRDALEAAQFYARTFPESAVGHVFHAPADYPAGQAGDVLTVEFTVMDAINDPGRAAASRAFNAMMTTQRCKATKAEVGSPAHRAADRQGLDCPPRHQAFVRRPALSDPSRQQRSTIVNQIVWLVGAVVIVLFVLSYFGLR